MLLFVHGFSGPFPGCLFMGSRVPIPGCFTFFTAIWLVFHQLNPMISMPTSPSESLLLFNPQNQLNFDVTGFNNTQASHDNRSCRFPRTTGIVHNSVDVLNLWHLHSTDDISSSISRQLDHVVSTTRSTSYPSSTEVTSFVSSCTRQTFVSVPMSSHVFQVTSHIVGLIALCTRNELTG